MATILLPPASSKKYSSKSTSSSAANTATASSTVTAAIPTSSLSDKRKYGQMSNAVQSSAIPTTPANDFPVPTGQPSSAKHKKTHSVTTTVPAIAATTTATTTTRKITQDPPATLSTSRDPSNSAGLSRARSTSSTYPATTTTNTVPARTTTNSATTATAATALPNKKKSKTVVTKDWFDEDAPF